MHGVFVGLVAFRRLQTKTNLSRRQLEKAVHLLWEVISQWGVCKQQGTPLLWEKRQELPPSLVFPPAWAAHHKHNDFQSLVAQQKLTPSLPSAFQSVRFFLPCSFLSWETKLVILIRRRHDGKKKNLFSAKSKRMNSIELKLNNLLPSHTLLSALYLNPRQRESSLWCAPLFKAPGWISHAAD